MPFSDYSTTPGSNTTIGGVNVAEGCAPGGLNNAVRQIAADGRALSDTVAALPASLPLTGGTVTGEILRQSQGAHLHHGGSAQISGKVTFLPEGSATPTLAEGDIVFFYT